MFTNIENSHHTAQNDLDCMNGVMDYFQNALHVQSCSVSYLDEGESAVGQCVKHSIMT